MAERLIVVQVVEGSSPFIHPPLQQAPLGIEKRIADDSWWPEASLPSISCDCEAGS